MEDIPELTITENPSSKRIINIQINDEILEKLIFPFNKFDITALRIQTIYKIYNCKKFR